MHFSSIPASFIILSILFIIISILHLTKPVWTLPICRNLCGGIAINYPFTIDDGCGAPQYRKMLNCSSGDLFFLTPSGNYKVRSIEYEKQTMVVYDPSMSTCSTLQPHHDFILTEIQSVVIPPTSDTIFVLLNCSIDSPVLNHYRSLCFNFSGHSCDELYSSCTPFRIFHPIPGGGYPSCCYTGYNTVKLMSMNILDCSHYTTVYNTDDLKGVGPLDWSYGIKLSYMVPNTGCDRCQRTGGTCGFDTETEVMLCVCAASVTNSTRECAGGTVTGAGHKRTPWVFFQVLVGVIGAYRNVILP